jgi:GLPGLI family protein
MNIPKYKWKILNELKDIEGYVCMKAETKDTVNNVVIHAWFTDKIPVMSGPEGFSGLPGMILALDFNDDDVNIVATKVDMAPQKASGTTHTAKNKRQINTLCRVLLTQKKAHQSECPGS